MENRGIIRIIYVFYRDGKPSSKLLVSPLIMENQMEKKTKIKWTLGFYSRL